MFDEIGQIIMENEIVATASDFNMGVEVEMHRVNSAGELSDRPYPQAIGSQRRNKYIKNDFLQMQTEIITPTTAHSVDAMHYLMQLNDTLRNALAPDELLWPLSMPPALPKDKSQIPISDVDPAKKAYYHEWAKIHGYTSGIPTGVHLNISVSEHVLDVVWKKVKAKQDLTHAEFINHVYEKIVQGIVYYEWLITYLFGNSPIAETNFFDDDEGPKEPVRSIRESHFGLGNKLKGDYSSVVNYINGIEQGIKDGALLTEAEFHGSVRFKKTNAELTQALDTGVDYVELRMLDLDPGAAVGVRTSTVRFIRMLLTYFLMTPALADKDQIVAKLDQGMAMNETVALENPKEQTIYQREGQELMEQLQTFGATIHWGPEYQEVLDVMQDRLDNASLTPSATLCDHIKNDSLKLYALRVGSRYQNRAHKNPTPFKGFAEHPDMVPDELRKELFDKSDRPDKFNPTTNENEK
ncbi:glutamate--cysteine ligase [Paucilactobacillus wasatchensis]|uniref:Glutamate--cysteine ligase n=1 Tax=Paucilactobacillus wasatchensis TaxID=1335616 RepID=A0A0D1A5W7_9LACO|nr:glutamate--cysteine ligase [Paucilactobacillus wasatchensis]KIS03042.1 Glutamate--cysteine ligase [Paucilactobacillus wasatchensis]